MRRGAQAPETLEITIENPSAASDPLDLSTVSALRLLVRRPGDHVVWDTTITTQTTTKIVAEHVFAISDAWEPGSYEIEAELTVPSGVRRAGPGALPVGET